MPTFSVLGASDRFECEDAAVFGPDGKTIGGAELVATPLRTYEGAGMRTEDYKSGDKITLTVTEDELRLDFITVNYAPDPQAVSVGAIPSRGERLTVSLDGIWSIGTKRISGTRSVPDTVPTDVDFINSIPVPGLWHSAAYDLGEYESTMSWYRKL